MMMDLPRLDSRGFRKLQKQTRRKAGEEKKAARLHADDRTSRKSEIRLFAQ
ncbi:hypothetical protein EYF80_063449 [Liparis tanakae]|uniref:Uncharacterized protein n=1 Tax=Liparis tanakae TaxID=230148 RepID=A0A4Z2ED29_9TELE|nr:hypothetical protein EYF80_063449 [Liparis tanakae]